MKANEAPEKIYVYIPDDDIVGTASIQKGFPHQFVTDEYVSKNAFIKKACDWIKYNNENGGCLFDNWEDDFKKYMEGKV